MTYIDKLIDFIYICTVGWHVYTVVHRGEMEVQYSGPYFTSTFYSLSSSTLRSCAYILFFVKVGECITDKY